MGSPLRDQPVPDPQGLNGAGGHTLLALDKSSFGFQDWHRVEVTPRFLPILTGPCPHPHLALLLCQPLKHVGIELLLPRKLLTDPLLAERQLGLGGFVAGIELQDLLEVSSSQVKVIHCQVGLSPAEKALLVVAVQLQGLRHREEAATRPQILQLLWPRLGSKDSPWQDEAEQKWGLHPRVSLGHYVEGPRSKRAPQLVQEAEREDRS